MIALLEEAFVPYPFNSYGSIVDDDSVGYALETQTRAVYSRAFRESTVVLSSLTSGSGTPCRHASARFASASDPRTVRYTRLIAPRSSRPAETVSFQTPGDGSRLDPCPR